MGSALYSSDPLPVIDGPLAAAKVCGWTLVTHVRGT